MKKNESKSKKENTSKEELNLLENQIKKQNPEKNFVEICGYAADKPTPRTFENGNKLATFSIATHEDIKNEKGEWTRITMWHPVVTWNRLADHAMQYINKGSLVNLKGRIRRRSYVDSEGLIRIKFELVANDLKANIA